MRLTALFVAWLAAFLFPTVALASPPEKDSPFPWNPPTPAFKIEVDETGLYELSYQTLTDAGVPVDNLDPRTLQIFEAGHEIAIQVLGEADGRFDVTDKILFIGRSINTRYTKTNIYWLTFDQQPGLRINYRIEYPRGAPLSTYVSSVRDEENQIYVSTLPLAAGHDHWYGPPIQAAGIGNPGERVFHLQLNDVAANGEAHLEAQFAGNVTGRHHLKLFINNQLIYEGEWNNRTLHQVSATAPQTILHDGDNQIKVQLVNDTPNQAFDMVYTDWIELHFNRKLIAREYSLDFSIDEPGSWQLDINGFDTYSVRVYDITDIAHPQQIILWESPPTLQAALNTYRQYIFPPRRLLTNPHFTLGVRITHPKRYLIVDAHHLLSPNNITKDQPSNLQTPHQGADYILITHRDFWQAATRLAQYRTDLGMSVTVVDVQDIYDEFNGGLMSAEAIHDFLAYAYNHWPAPRPQYVLLLGDGTYDMRCELPNTAPTFIPPYLAFVDTLLGEVATDNRFVTITGNDSMPEMYIGRMPANTAAEADVMVSKTIEYEQSPTPGNWNQNILFVTDDIEDGGGDFYALSDELADGYADPPANTIKFLPPPYRPTKIYAGVTCDRSNPEYSSECKQQLSSFLENEGALILNYIGHATKGYWASEKIMDQPTIESIDNEGKWPITLAMACVDGFFHQPGVGEQSFAEANVRAKGGSVASWSATSLGLAKPHQLLEKGFFLALFHEHLSTLGEVTTAAKRYTLEHAPQKKHYTEVIDVYTLFGDPALKIHVAQP